jgi:hypothetical protein
MFSPLADVLEIVESLETTDETRRKEIFNQDLGMIYSPKGGRITKEVLDKCKRDYATGFIPDKSSCMGVDVGSLIYVVIRSQPDLETGERDLIYAGPVDTFLALANLIRKFNVGLCVIDALPETRKAREFQEAFPTQVWLAYYTGQKAGSKKPEELQWNKDDGIVIIDRTRMIDTTFARFYSMENTLPPNAEDIKEYYSHLISPVRIIEDDNIAKYINSQPDHYAHAETYCTAASMGRRPDPHGATINVSKEEYMSPAPPKPVHRSMIERRKTRSRRRY